jgi:hypothetical protein
VLGEPIRHGVAAHVLCATRVSCLARVTRRGARTLHVGTSTQGRAAARARCGAVAARHVCAARPRRVRGHAVRYDARVRLLVGVPLGVGARARACLSLSGWWRNIGGARRSYRFSEYTSTTEIVTVARASCAPRAIEQNDALWRFI